MDKTAPGLVIVTVKGDFREIHDFALKLETSLREFLAGEYGRGAVEQPQIGFEVDER